MNDEQFKAVSLPERVFLESLVTGDVSSSIERQEKQGQQALLQSQNLPRQSPHWEKLTIEQLYAAWNIAILREVDGLFFAVQLPEGWKITGEEHPLWTRLLDEQNRPRALIFYKAAFYDRSAEIGPLQRYRVVTDYDTIRPGRIVTVVDRANEEVLYEAGRVPNDQSEYYKEQDKLERMAVTWLNEHYPDHQNPLAYW